MKVNLFTGFVFVFLCVYISRAVQRSLAIIRQARQKKQKAKQYCMYYNRFGKCNHGDTCPYIHDPDKVAVCTRYWVSVHTLTKCLTLKAGFKLNSWLVGRFLRGTCKRTDGTCPFSHKVAKEKVSQFTFKGSSKNRTR